jgi:hypothetical protein
MRAINQITQQILENYARLAEEAKRGAYHLDSDIYGKARIVATCHYYRCINGHPAGTTLENYLPHWANAQGRRTDLYNPQELADLKGKGLPAPIDGKRLKVGYSYVWEDA